MVRIVANMAGMKEGLAAVLSLLLVALPSSLKAQTSSSSNVTLTAIVVQPVSITSSGGSDGAGNIDFGLVLANNTYSINPNTSASANLYTVGAAAGMAMTVTFTSPTLSLSDGAGNTLTFTPQIVGSQSLTSQGTATSVTSGGTITMGGTGSYYMWLGGSVTVPKGQAGGTYTGTFNLTVSY